MAGTYTTKNRKTGEDETRVDRPTTFPYMNPSSGKLENRSLYPSAFEKFTENFTDTNALDVQRERYLKTLASLGQSAPAATNWETPED